jgi:hypothetical protein
MVETAIVAAAANAIKTLFMRILLKAMAAWPGTSEPGFVGLDLVGLS